MGTAFIGMGILSLVGVLVAIAFYLARLSNSVDMIPTTPCKAMPACSEVMQKYEVTPEWAEKYAAEMRNGMRSCGVIIEASQTRHMFGKTEMVSMIDDRLGEGEDNLTREQIRSVLNHEQDILAAMSPAEAIAYVRHVRNG